MEAINVHGEVRKLVTDSVERRETPTVAWFVDRIMSDHSEIEGADADFYLVCTRAQVKDIVRATIGKFTPKEQPTDRQLVLDGFQHLQIAYTFERAGETVLVPVDLCTDMELSARAREYDEMALGCRAHARELRQYITVRTGAVA